jgi:hypothetical protein
MLSSLLFLSYIFLFWFCQQENVGQENESGLFPQSSALGQNDDQGRRNYSRGYADWQVEFAVVCGYSFASFVDV